MKKSKESLKREIPEYVLTSADRLVEEGFEVYLVGGAVRDIFLGREPKDFDLATNALPDQIESAFPRSVNTNAKFGTILVIVSDRYGERYDLEITTFRKDEDYSSGRWPNKVTFTDEITQDLSRRDFTINAMAINLDTIEKAHSNFEEVLVDPFGGMQDLDSRLVKAVGEPIERFTEDGLRSYKACRIASELNYLIDGNTFDAIKESQHIAKRISMERIRDEFNKLLMYSPKPSYGIELLRKTGLLEIFLPELIECIGIEQPQWHSEDVYHHCLSTMDIAEDEIKLAALLHDIGKSRTRTEDKKGIHFYSHDVVGSEMAMEILTRMRYPKHIIKKVCQLIRWHMFYYPSADWRKINEVRDLKLSGSKNSNQGGWTDSAVRRFIKNVGEEYLESLFKLRIADASSNKKSEFDPEEIKALQERIAILREQEMALNIKDLDISGKDLRVMGITPGPRMGEILNYLLDRVIEDPFLNKKETLSRLVNDFDNT